MKSLALILFTFISFVAHSTQDFDDLFSESRRLKQFKLEGVFKVDKNKRKKFRVVAREGEQASVFHKSSDNREYFFKVRPSEERPGFLSYDMILGELVNGSPRVLSTPTFRRKLTDKTSVMQRASNGSAMFIEFFTYESI